MKRTTGKRNELSLECFSVGACFREYSQFQNFGHKKRASELYRTATTSDPCYIPVLGDYEGAGRIGLARLQKYKFEPNYKRSCRNISSPATERKNAIFVHLKSNCGNTNARSS